MLFWLVPISGDMRYCFLVIKPLYVYGKVGIQTRGNFRHEITHLRPH
jgi:hypothetical protein